MKKLLSIVAILFATSLAMAGNDPAENNVLVLTGQILWKEKATIMLFEYDAQSDEWFKLEHLSKARQYEFVMNPTSAYQVWFQSEKYTKILYISPGDPGMWIAQMNIDFSKEWQLYGHLYQTCDSGGFTYSTDYLTVNSINNLPAMNCVLPELETTSVSTN